MREIQIDKNASGKRLDKFLLAYFSECSMGFLFKMLRKKNIILNGKKATGKELLQNGDVISVFFSDETFQKFTNKYASDSSEDDKDLFLEYQNAFKRYGSINIVYEDDNIVLINKPSGILSQKAEPGDLSMNEWLIGYLLDKGDISRESLALFKPSVCNRLDRNTSGLLICSKSLPGAQKMSEILKDRSLHKYYKTVVIGWLTADCDLSGYLYKDRKTNKVTLTDSIPKDKNIDKSEYSRIETSYKVIKTGELHTDGKQLKVTELLVLLHTGKTHQIRAHLSSIGHPIIGDSKYGNKNVNNSIKQKYGLKYQLLHAFRLEFPEIEGELSNLSGKVFEADVPDIFSKIMEDFVQ